MVPQPVVRLCQTRDALPPKIVDRQLHETLPVQLEAQVRRTVEGIGIGGHEFDLCRQRQATRVGHRGLHRRVPQALAVGNFERDPRPQDLDAVVLGAGESEELVGAGSQQADGDVDPVEACARLADAGADVVGFNCIRGPATMVELVEQVRSRVSCHVAALPVPYRTTEDAPTFFAFNDPACDVLPADGTFPAALDPFSCNRYEMGAFARRIYDKGVHYVGVCCGAGPHHIRAVAEALGRTPPASRYSPDMSKHAYRGTDPKIPEAYRRFGHQGE